MELKLLGTFRRGVFIAAACLAVAVVWSPLAIGGSDGNAPGYTQATKVGSDTCLECHDTMNEPDKAGLHRLAAGDKAQCESCHGPGSVHAESSDPADILHPARQPDLVQMNCTKCHSNMTKGWKGHKIQVANMHCTDCHKIHQPVVKGTLVKPEPELCTSCHSDVNAKMHMPSHHPVKEGKMKCTSCHDMSGKTLFAKERVNDTCLSCHAQYRGPFVFEHAPVAEDCTICHDPHGTVANNLLKQNEPFICLTCHQMHFHTQLSGYEGDFSSPLFPDRGGHSRMLSMKSAFLTKCTQCHSTVHGSDLPSQAISGQGKALTR